MPDPAATLEATDHGVALRLKVIPGASRDRIVGLLGHRLKIQTAAPPEAGKANKAVCRLLAQTLGVSKSDLQITAGHTRPEKTVHIAGLSHEQLTQCLEEHLG